MQCYFWSSRGYLTDQWELPVFVVGMMYCSMLYEYIADHHISFICLWMAAHKKKDDLSILIFIFMTLKPSLRMTDSLDCCSDFFFKVQNSFYLSWNLHDSFIVLSFVLCASAIGFRWPEELPMVLFVMLLLFSHSPSFTPCPCGGLCSHAP